MNARTAGDTNAPAPLEERRTRRKPPSSRLTSAANAGGSVQSRRNSVYGDSDELRRLRASDVRRKRDMSAAEWQRLMRRRELSFSLPKELSPHPRRLLSRTQVRK